MHMRSVVCLSPELMDQNEMGAADGPIERPVRPSTSAGKKEWSMDADVLRLDLVFGDGEMGNERGSKREQGSMTGQRLEYSPT